MRKGPIRPTRVLVLGAVLAAGSLAASLPFPQTMSRTWAQPPAGAHATTAVRELPTGPVVVRTLPGRTAQVEQRLVAAGGRVTRELPIVDGFAATLTPATAAALAADPAVLAVTPDSTGHVMSLDPLLGYDPTGDTGSLHDIQQIIGATAAYTAGYTGKGVDIALIDTGVAPVPGLNSGNLVHGPDLSFDSVHPDVRYLDSFGHGTHMASIMAGRDKVLTPVGYAGPSTYHGIAPDARVVSLKVGASDGSADVSQVIAAIDWVAQHAHDPGLNIRVLNLSYGTDAKQDYHLDPLAYAAQAAWRKGILVVVAGGNDGTSNVELANPASDGNLLAVGAEDPMGTVAVADDTVPAFSNRGTSTRHVDLVAPGVHVLGLRVPNGVVDQAYPSARVGTRFFRGSGTSQATAVVSGAAALLFQRYPELTPQQAKMILGYGATFLAKGTTTNAGAGIVNVSSAMSMAGSGLVRSLAATTTATFGTGQGSLEAARGSSHVAMNGVTLTGEKDIFGKAFSPAAWAPKSLSGKAWGADGSWNGVVWTGTGFDATGGSWLASRWASTSWAGADWTASRWAGRTWVANSWDAATWQGSRWASDTWSASRWAGAGWSSATWS